MKRPSPRSADSDFLSALLHAGLDLEAAFILMLLKRADLTMTEQTRAGSASPGSAGSGGH